MNKLTASYDWLERELDVAFPIHVGHIALATARAGSSFASCRVSGHRPRLVAWFAAFEDRPSMRATPLSGETHD